ncbi:MAG: lysophospholipid acyltransferase family protein [Planctomycetia bacterium]|nr:lysophospholipid acyltransferase family protein [Planctomycetia bacterium]
MPEKKKIPFKDRIKNTAKNVLIRSAGGAMSALLPFWLSSLDFRVAYYDPIIDPSYANDGQRRIYVFWHEYLQLMIHLRKHCGISMLLSKHADADIVAEIAALFGFGTVRGSTQRGGANALLQLAEDAKKVHLTITPDGPRGPRRKLAPGCIYLASKLQMPIVFLGIAYDRPYRLNSWDRFAIPRFGSKARIIASSDIWIPSDLSKEGIEEERLRVEGAMHLLDTQAEDWVASDYSIEGECGVLPGPKYSVLYYTNPRQGEIGD